MVIIEYPKCSTCQKAKKHLDEKKVKYEDRMIKENPPTQKELNEWIEKYDVDINKFFNTSGMLYREYCLKDRLKGMKLEEKIELLSSNGMLVKRPILITKDRIILGYKEKEYEDLFAE